MKRTRLYPKYAVDVSIWNEQYPDILIADAKKKIDLQRDLLSREHFEKWMTNNGVTEILKP